MALPAASGVATTAAQWRSVSTRPFARNRSFEAVSRILSASNSMKSRLGGPQADEMNARCWAASRIWTNSVRHSSGLRRLTVCYASLPAIRPETPLFPDQLGLTVELLFRNFPDE